MPKAKNPPEWTTIQYRLGDLEEWEKNPSKITPEEAADLAESLDSLGRVIPFVAAAPPNGKKKLPLADGHQRKGVELKLRNTSPDTLVDVRIPDRPLSERERAELAIRLRKNTGEFDTEKLRRFFEREDLAAWGFKDEDFEGFDLHFEEETKSEEISEEEASRDTAPELARAKELLKKWKVSPGDIWKLGDHLLLCGDSTDPESFRRLMGKDKAVLIHADPPYGMGKEKEGIENDNLYEAKLDRFQMEWWKAARPRLLDNASAYIWGNAPDLWRLWYAGGLQQSERLTFRNEIVWDKQDGTNPTLRVNGKTFSFMRSHYQSERIFFFMLGEQGFNNNSDNYWEGWEPIRSYLEGEMKRAGWTLRDLNRITGTVMGKHWVTRSQWSLITEDHYKKIQEAARELGAFGKDHEAFTKEHALFRREYDKLRKEFYSTRAFFDNSFENMTDVWRFPRVDEEEREDHPTPKPLALISRILRISSQAGDIILAPFAGSGPEIIASENLGRKSRSIEKEPAYCSVILERFYKHTQREPKLLSRMNT